MNSNKTLLPGYKLVYAYVDAACSASGGLAGIGRLLGSTEHPIDAVIGPACSLGCEPTAFLCAGQNLLQISYSCTSPLLSSMESFPTFLRTGVAHMNTLITGTHTLMHAPTRTHPHTVGSYVSQGSAVIAVARHFGWKSMAIISTTQNIFLQTANNLWKIQFPAAGINESIIETFVSGAFVAEENRQSSVLEVIKLSGIRVEMALAYAGDLVQVALQAAAAGMTSVG